MDGMLKYLLGWGGGGGGGGGGGIHPQALLKNGIFY